MFTKANSAQQASGVMKSWSWNEKKDSVPSGLRDPIQTRPVVSVVVVTKNEEENIGACLISLVNQEFPPEDFEIIVVDGGSSETVVHLIKSFPVRFIDDSGGNIPHGRNIGVRAARADLIAFIDSDCVAESKWLSKLVKSLWESDDSVVAVGGPNIVFDDDSTLSRAIGHIQSSLIGSGGSAQSHRIVNRRLVDSLPNCNVIYRKYSLLREGYDETLDIGEDADINFRLKEAGRNLVFFPDAVVMHHRAGTLRQFVRQMFSYGAAMARVSRKHERIIRWYSAVPLGLVLLLIAASVLAAFDAIFLLGLGALVGLYLVVVAGSVAMVSIRQKELAPLLGLFLLPLQHFAYAVGFARGLLS